MSKPPPTHTFASPDGTFRRPKSTFRSFISPSADAHFPAEKGRYILHIHLGCPWAHRTNIVRTLKGLEDIIPMVVWDASLIHEGSGWAMSGAPGHESEPLYGFTKLKELYEKAEPGYSGRCTVPMLWDRKLETIVSNESSELLHSLYTPFDAFLPAHLRSPALDLYPPHLAPQIDAMNAWTYPDLNNGVYRAGFATAQDAYNDAVTAVFGALDRLEDHLATHPGPYLFGETITDADVRVYTTLVRFDVAYFTIFKCNLKMVRYEYPKLHAWLRGLYWDQDERVGRAFRGTVDFDAYKKGYTNAVRGQVVPIGPEVGVLPL